GDVGVKTLELQERRPGRAGPSRDRPVQRLFHREAERQGVTDGGVTRDALDQRYHGGQQTPLGMLLDAPMDEPQPRLELEDRLADHGQAEVAGLDQARVDGSDRDLVDARAIDRDKRVGLLRGPERRWWPGIGAHRI